MNFICENKEVIIKMLVCSFVVVDLLFLWIGIDMEGLKKGVKEWSLINLCIFAYYLLLFNIL